MAISSAAHDPGSILIDAEEHLYVTGDAYLRTREPLIRSTALKAGWTRCAAHTKILKLATSMFLERIAKRLLGGKG